MHHEGMLLFKKNGDESYVVPSKFHEDKEVILNALASRNSCSLDDIPQRFQDDKDCILTVLENTIMNSRYEHPLFKHF